MIFDDNRSSYVFEVVVVVHVVQLFVCEPYVAAIPAPVMVLQPSVMPLPE